MGTEGAVAAPRAGVIGVWNARSGWSRRDRAIAVGAEFRLSWSAAVGQLSNLGLITTSDHDSMHGNVPRRGEFAKLGLLRRDEPAAPYLSPAVLNKQAIRLQSGDVELLGLSDQA